MPTPLKGEVRFLDGHWTTRVTIHGKVRRTFVLPTCRTEAEAVKRSSLLAESARALRKAGHAGTKPADMYLAALASAPNPKGPLALIAELCGGIAELIPDEPDGPTFRQVADDWTSGKLHRDFPDYVKARESDLDDTRLGKLCKINVAGGKFGDLPIDNVTVEHCEAVARSLPESAKTPRTRHHYLSLLGRVLSLAAYPLKLIPASPLPKGFIPKLQKPPARAFLYPDEEAKLMACSDVPLVRRMLYGVLVREGLRRGEAAELRWRHVDLDRGAVTLDRNKTRDGRPWKMDPAVVAALKAWRERFPNAGGDDPVFPDSDGLPLEDKKLFRQLRMDLKTAKVERHELHEAGENWGRFRAHDLRGTFVTLALANGKTEAWVMDRTGHTTSAMLNRYRRSARFAAELDLGPLAPLNEAIPEFRPAPGSPQHCPTLKSNRGQRVDIKKESVVEAPGRNAGAVRGIVEEVATATTIASSKLLETAVNDSIVDWL